MLRPNETEPFAFFHQWMKQAEEKEINDPNAMALATTTPEGRPSVRMVLLKGVDGEEIEAARRGFVFYTNFESQKGTELLANPFASLCFHWKSIRRQIRIEGQVEVVTDEEADAYFASRPRESRIGAWASTQSREMSDEWGLEKRVAKFAAKFAIGPVPRPPHWSGFRVIPDKFEYWEDRPFRLHRRTIYRRDQEDPGQWTTSRLFP